MHHKEDPMFHSNRNLANRLDLHGLGRSEQHWVRTAVSTITMAAAVGAAGLAVWKYLQENPDLFKSRADAGDDEDLDAADYDGPTAPDVPPPVGNA
jgi:hypothetical protein